MYIHNFLTNHLVKEFDWSTFAKVIIKHQVAYGVYDSQTWSMTKELNCPSRDSKTT